MSDDTIRLTEAEQWQVRAMEADIEALSARLQLARELQTTALTGMLQRHGGDTSKVYRVSPCGTKLEPAA